MSTMYCKAVCRGASCKHEAAPEDGDPEAAAVPGLKSAWVAPHRVLLMARPSWRKDAEYGVFGWLADAGVTVVVNLQNPGEHAHCGDGLDPVSDSGYAYDPLKLSERGITHAPCGWTDMAAPSVSVLARAVFFVDYGISVLGGATAIHCHAGLGRSGLVAAAYMVYAEGHTANSAIAVVRAARAKAIQTRKQIKALELYARAVHAAAAVLPPPRALVASWRDTHLAMCTQSPSMCPHWAHFRDALYFQHAKGPDGVPVPAPRSLTSILADQATVLVHGEESRTLKYIPKAVKLLLDVIAVAPKAALVEALEAVTGRDDASRGPWMWSEYALAQALNGRMWDTTHTGEYTLTAMVGVLVRWMRWGLDAPLLPPRTRQQSRPSRAALECGVAVAVAFGDTLESAAGRELIIRALTWSPDTDLPPKLVAVRRQLYHGLASTSSSSITKLDDTLDSGPADASSAASGAGSGDAPPAPLSPRSLINHVDSEPLILSPH